MALIMQKMTKAMMRKSSTTAIRLPKLMATSGVCTSPAAVTTASWSTSFHWEKSIPLVSTETTGMMMSLTREVVILPKAPPMTTPTAISSTLPRMAKALNSSINFFMVRSSKF